MVPPVKLGVVDGFKTSVAAFATDIPALTNWGTPYLFGPGSIHVAHRDDEFVAIDELCACRRCVRGDRGEELSARLGDAPLAGLHWHDALDLAREIARVGHYCTNSPSAGDQSAVRDAWIRFPLRVESP